ncbi:MAG TPA: ZIP family metal transporter [Candidatus Ventricola intestinavium]|nr:ZIP family metal transporter [Candidatus Ventricola intestinavium]
MRSVIWAGCGTAFTFAMTTLGAALVFFFRRSIGERVQCACLGFAAGVMSAAAVFSLLVPAMEQTQEMGGSPFVIVTLGFVLGAAMIACVDALLRRMKGVRRAGDISRRRTLMFTAVTLHNIPEGMAVGLAFALAARDGGLGLAAAVTLALGIGIQNFPEGAAVALPLRQSGMSRMRAFALGTLSGAVEPVFGVLVVLAATVVRQAMPLLMAFSAGAMMYVVICEMIPEASGERSGTRFAMVGYIVMMALDIALG